MEKTFDSFMSEMDKEQPAFPFCFDAEDRIFASSGMTLRDWFAGQALAGIATTCGFQGGPWDKLAKDAYDAADAMLAARNSPTE